MARNIASRGIPVALYNRTAARTDTMMREHASEGEFVPSQDVGAFVESIERPRAIMLMVKAGEPVDEAIAELRPHLAEGDLLIDGGNSFFQDTRRR
ncbi:MAG TPA: NAD(P)-binding domain-containing protein, partial [Candidatus Binatia bacterium]|nr:NAD(P)-binding domain-containing protein [Candidatus Binatia bacterium]